jgi:hypothetical protein
MAGSKDPAILAGVFQAGHALGPHLLLNNRGEAVPFASSHLGYNFYVIQGLAFPCLRTSLSEEQDGF